MTSNADEIKPRGFTYVELGNILGISPEAARLRAIRRKWKRISANDGGPARVDVTLADLKPSEASAKRPKRDTAKPRTRTNNEAVHEQTIAALNAHVNTLTQELEKARENLQTTQDDRAAERQRVADLTDEVLRLNRELVEAHKGSGLLARLFKRG